MSNKQYTQQIHERQARDYPIAYGLVIKPGTLVNYGGGRKAVSHGWQIRVTCPYCGKYHYHGWEPDRRKRVETRLTHCIGQKRSSAGFNADNHYRLVAERELQ